jgi:chloramphenicol-sensitive protein RarD
MVNEPGEFETWLLAPPAIGFLALLTVHGSLSIPNGTHAALLASSGLVTSLPLLCFGAAATRLPMSTLGVMQYLAPTIQFFLGIWVFHEPLPVSRLIGFTIIWLAIAIFTAAALHGQRRPHATTSSAASPATPSRRILS